MALLVSRLSRRDECGGGAADLSRKEMDGLDSRQEGCFPTAWVAEEKDTDCGSLVVVVHYCFEGGCGEGLRLFW